MKKTCAAVALALAGFATTAVAGGQQVLARASGDGRSLEVRTYDCGTPASLSLRGTAEGTVGGERRTIPLEITRSSEAGVFHVARQWPAEGRWALVLTVEGGHAVSTLVALEPGPRVRVASQRMAFEKPSAERIAAALEGR